MDTKPLINDKYANGLLIQWGVTGEENQTILAYTDINSYAVISQINEAGSYSYYKGEVFRKSSPSLIIRDGAQTISWLTRGY